MNEVSTHFISFQPYISTVDDPGAKMTICTLEMRILKVSSGFSKSTQQVSFKNLIHHEIHHFKEVGEVGELGWRYDPLLCILVIYVCNRIAPGWGHLPNAVRPSLP